jgi:hypothetical protein
MSRPAEIRNKNARTPLEANPFTHYYARASNSQETQSSSSRLDQFLHDWHSDWRRSIRGNLLTAVRHWSPERVGPVVAAQSIAMVVAQAPAGALVDWSICKSVSAQLRRS